VIDAVNVACQEQIISPVKHYLEGLAPSNIDISEIFEKYFGVIPDNEEHRDFIGAASSLFFKQAVARAIDAGCKADTVVVFEGKQGIGKSSGLRALFGADWFKDSMPPMGSKDASDYIVGAWCIELAEMAFQRKGRD
jgi:predicted P-loop ATPase